MAVPKKRTSKAKKNSRKANWKRKAAKSAQKSVGLSNKGACSNCEYVKRFKRTAYWSRIGLIGAIVAFVITTYLIY